MLGPSGCGKTTLLRLIAGIEVADTGKVFFDTQDVSNLPAHQRGIGMVFQNYALWPHMTVAENLSFGLSVQGVRERERQTKVSHALDLVRLADLKSRYPHELSGGQQQRVALARALVLEPKVVLLDEPLSNLDTRLRAELREEILRIHRTLGLTMVYVTHDQHEVLSMADRAALMGEGRIVQCADPRTLYQAPADKYTASFFGEANFLEGIVESDGKEQNLELQDGARFPLSGDYRRGSRLTVLLRPEGIALDGSGPLRLQVKLSESAYYGSQQRLDCELASGQRLLVYAAGDRVLPKIGSKIEISFRPDQLVVLTG